MYGIVDIILGVDDDFESLVIVGYGRCFYAFLEPGKGFILKNRVDDFLEVFHRGLFRVFHVKPKATVVGYFCDEIPSNVRNVLEKYLSKLPKEVAAEFRDAWTEISVIEYFFTEASIPSYVRSNEGLVLSFKVKEGTGKYRVKVVKATIYYGGSACCPMSTYASETLRKWREKYPENTIIRKNIYAKDHEGYKGVDSSISMKIVVEAPKELEQKLSS